MKSIEVGAKRGIERVCALFLVLDIVIMDGDCSVAMNRTITLYGPVTAGADL